jgi:hypothetical protein
MVRIKKMYKYKPGIQKDKTGYSESVNLTGQKLKDMKHLVYEVLENAILNYEKKDKRLELIFGYKNLILDNLRYPTYQMNIKYDYPKRKAKHTYQITIKDITLDDKE